MKTKEVSNLMAPVGSTPTPPAKAVEAQPAVGAPVQVVEPPIYCSNGVRVGQATARY